MGTGLLVAGSIAAVHRLRRQAVLRLLGEGDWSPVLAICVSAVVVGIVTVGLSFEIDRIVEHARLTSAIRFSFPAWQLRQLAWTMLWTLMISLFVTVTTRTNPPPIAGEVLHGGSMLIGLLAAKFFLVDTLLYRVLQGAAPVAPVFNLQLLTGLIIAGSLIWMRIMASPPGTADKISSSLSLAAILVFLWTLTMELDRIFQRFAATSGGPFADPILAEQVALSIFWSFFAVLCVLAGFRWRAAGLRYFGLGLFAVTLVKVVAVDMSQIGTGIRSSVSSHA